MSSHPIENRKVLLVNEEERVRKWVSERKLTIAVENVEVIGDLKR